jgi:ribose transport system substrate-binding protein
VLEQADNLKDNVNDARALADDLLTKHPDVDVIFGFNDNSAIGAGLAVKSRGLTDVLIFGINGTPEGIKAVKDGTITATYDADQWGMGYQAAELGDKLQGGGTASPVALPFKRWDKANADQWVPAEQRCAAVR